MNKAKKQHTVPQFYLRGFAQLAQSKHRLFVIDKHIERQSFSRVEEVACQNHFYTLDSTDESERYAFEEMLGRIDTDSAVAVRELIASKRLPSGELFTDFIGFVAMLFARTPTTRNAFEKPLSNVMRQVALLATEEKSRWTDTLRAARRKGIEINDVNYEQVRDFVRSDRYELSMNQNLRLRLILEVAPIMMDLLARRNWCIVEAPADGSAFVTSDRPISIMWHEPFRYPSSRPPGFGMTRTTVFLPISASIALFGRFEPVKQYARATSECVASINMATASRAARFVYSREREFSLILPDGRIGSNNDLFTWFEDTTGEQSSSSGSDA